MKDEKSWKDFERLVERLHRGFHRNAIITPHDHLMGRETERSREIDISIRYKLGANDLLIIVECRKYQRKIDVPRIEAFTGVMKDVGANLGVMVCERGFSKTAIRLAGKNNIELFTLADTQKPSWQITTQVVVYVEDWLLTPLVLRHIDSEGRKTDFQDDQAFTLVDRNGKKLPLAGEIKEYWRSLEKKESREYFFEIGVGNSEVCNAKLILGFKAEPECYHRNATLGLLGLTKISDGLTYTDAFEIRTTKDPAVKQSKPARPALGKNSVVVAVETCTVKTVSQPLPDMNLQTQEIKFTVSGGATPFSFPGILPAA